MFASTNVGFSRFSGLEIYYPFSRYCVIGIYVGLATVGIFVYWYVFDQSSPDHHTLVSLDQLMSWGKCKSWRGFRPLPVEGMTQGDPCSYFTTGKVRVLTEIF